MAATDGDGIPDQPTVELGEIVGPAESAGVPSGVADGVGPVMVGAGITVGFGVGTGVAVGFGVGAAVAVGLGVGGGVGVGAGVGTMTVTTPGVTVARDTLRAPAPEPLLAANE